MTACKANICLKAVARTLRFSLLAGAVCAAAMGAAEAQSLHPAEQQLIDTLSTALEPGSRTELRLGLGPVTTSAMGAGGKTKFYVLPLVFFNYSDIVDLDETELRVNLLSDSIFAGSQLSSSGFRAGPTLKVDFGRRAFASGVTGPGNVGTSVEVGAFASYSFGPARARVRVRQDIAAGHSGALAEFDIRTGIYKKDGLTIGVQLATSWASKRYMQSFFGVAPRQTNPAMAAYTPPAGFKDVRGGLVGEYNLTERWSLAASLQYAHKLGDALHSPIVAARGSSSRLNSGVFVLYTF